MATTAQLNQWLAAGVVTAANGAALASGVVRFYQPGTLTPRTVYSDAAAASPITQPVTLSAGGTALVYATAPVRMIVKDATDVSVIYDVTENVVRAEQVYVTSSSFNSGTETTLSVIADGWTTSAGGSAGLFKYKRAGASTERNLLDAIGEARVSVKDWAAVGDGVSNDTVAVAAAIAQAVSLGGGLVFFPPGTYIIDSALTVGANVALVGAGSAVSIIKSNNGGANAITLNAAGVGNNVIQGLQITHVTTSTGTGIACSSTSRIYMRDVVLGVSKYAQGMTFSACSNTSLYDCLVYGRDTGGGTGRALHYSTSGNNHLVVGGEVGADLSGTCIECDTGTNGFQIVGVNFSQGSVGVKLTSSSNDDMLRVIGCPGLSANMNTAFTEVSPASRGLYQVGNFVEGYDVDLAAGANHTPSPLLRGPNIRLRATSSGTITVNALATNPIVRGNRLVLHFFNNGGGAITWSLNALYHLVGGVAPVGTDGLHVIVEFVWDTSASCYREIARSSTS